MGKEQIDLRIIKYSEPIVEGERIVGFRLKEIPVKPFTDIDLAALPLEERAAHLEERLEAYSSLIQKESPSLFETGRPDSLFLARILYDLEIKDWEVKFTATQLEKTEQSYEEEKQRIEREDKHHGWKYREKGSLANLWLPKIEEATKRKTAEETLRNTVLDIFLKKFILVPDGLKRFAISAQDLLLHETFTQESLNNLLAQAQKRLERLTSKEHAAFFRYKEGADNLSSSENARILRQFIEHSFRKDEGPGKFDRALSDLSYTILKFYWRNVENLYPTNEQTPMIAFIHDFLFAGSLSQDPDLFLKGGNWLLANLKRKGGQSFDELDILMERGASEGEETNKWLSTQRKSPITPTAPEALTEEELIETWLNETGGKFVIGKNYDRSIGLDSAFSLLAAWGRWNLPKAYVEERTKRSGGKTRLISLAEGKWNFDSQPIVLWRKEVTSYSRATLLLDELVSALMPKSQYLTRIAELLGKKGETLATKDFHLSLMQKEEETFGKLPKVVQTSLRTNSLLFVIFIESAPEELSKVRETFAKNSSLKRQIRDENLEFIALNGDCFPVTLNPDLQKYSLASLIFRPHWETGGHQLQIVSILKDDHGNPFQTTIIIDQDGKFYYENGLPMILPLWLAAPFESLVLERLHFITSGALSQREAAKETQKETLPPERAVTIRRAHWRKLISMMGVRTYTLQSETAKVHAKFVKEKYGKDTDEENSRRRAAGTLGEKEVITFVKEVEDPKAPPNMLAYRP